MFRIWGKIWKENHLLRDLVVCDESEDTRTQKVRHALTDICMEFDLAQPVWLAAAIRDFQRFARCRFTQDAFPETIDFDYLELVVIEED